MIYTECVQAMMYVNSMSYSCGLQRTQGGETSHVIHMTSLESCCNICSEWHLEDLVLSFRRQRVRTTHEPTQRLCLSGFDLQ